MSSRHLTNFQSIFTCPQQGQAKAEGLKNRICSHQLLAIGGYPLSVNKPGN